MKNLILIVVAFLMNYTTIAAQVKSEKVEVLWGPAIKKTKKSTLSDIIGSDESGIYTLKINYKGRNSFFLEHYNNDLVQTKSVELSLKEQRKDRVLEFILQVKGELYLFSSFKNQKLKKNFLFVQRINKQDLSLDKDITKVAEIPYLKRSRINNGSFGHEMSRDSSKVLIYYNLPFKKGENERFGFHVFNEKMEQLWEKKVTLPYKEELFNINDYEIDNNGDCYLLGKIYNDKNNRARKGKPNYKYHILGYTENGAESNEYPIEIKDHFLTDMQIAINSSSNIICAGFYSELGNYSIKGSYFLTIDGKSKEVKSQSFKEFGIDFITQNMTARQERKAKKKKAKGKEVELYKYDLNNLILRSDGGALLIGEQYYVEIFTSTMPNGNGGTTTTTTYTYHYNDIIIVNISPQGEIEWTEKIPKRQISTNDGGYNSSFSLSVVNDKIYFAFNDNGKNLLYNGSGKVERYNGGKESVVTLVEVDSDGRFTRESLFSMNEVGVVIRPKVGKQIKSNELILFGQRKKIKRFAKVTFREE